MHKASNMQSEAKWGILDTEQHIHIYTHTIFFAKYLLPNRLAHADQ
jgi:hypothetical protein